MHAQHLGCSAVLIHSGAEDLRIVWGNLRIVVAIGNKVRLAAYLCWRQLQRVTRLTCQILADDQWNAAASPHLVQQHLHIHGHTNTSHLRCTKISNISHRSRSDALSNA